MRRENNERERNERVKRVSFHFPTKKKRHVPIISFALQLHSSFLFLFGTFASRAYVSLLGFLSPVNERRVVDAVPFLFLSLQHKKVNEEKSRCWKERKENRH